MATRVKMTDADAQALRKAPVARGKGSAKQREKERELETDVKVIRTRKTAANAKPELHHLPASQVIGVMCETMARCYEEMFSKMSAHDEEGNVVLDISEECYVLALTMYVGNDIDMPRQGLSVKEDAKASSTMKFCKECG